MHLPRLRALGASLALLWLVPLLAAPPAAHAQAGYQVVGSCGGVNYPATGVRPGTQDTSGHTCINGGGGTQSAPLGVTTTNDSTTVTLGAAFQSVIAASATRKGCLIQNPTTATEPLYVFLGANGSATTANSITLNPGGSVSCVDGPTVRQDNVSVTAATTGHAFYADVQ